MSKWTIDPAHTNVNFSVRHMMISTVNGKFGQFSGSLEFDPANPAGSSVEASVDTASVDTGVTDRDAHLRSADFFDVEKYPTMTFKSTSLDLKDNTSGKLLGDLTINGVTKPVTFEVEFLGQGVNPWGVPVVGFEATTKIDREAFGLTWNQALEAGGVLVSKEVKLTLDVQANPAQAE